MAPLLPAPAAGSAARAPAGPSSRGWQPGERSKPRRSRSRRRRRRREKRGGGEQTGGVEGVEEKEEEEKG